MKIQADVKVHLRNKEVKHRGAMFAQDLVLGLALEAAERARQAVAPGVGPGPHPHKPQSKHIDSGDLMRSIEADVNMVGEQAVATVGSDLPYAVFLEVGWHSAAGNFFRYPFIWPAITATQPSFPPMAAHKAKVWFTGDAGDVVSVPWKFYTIERG